MVIVFPTVLLDLKIFLALTSISHKLQRVGNGNKNAQKIKFNMTNFQPVCLRCLDALSICCSVTVPIVVVKTHNGKEFRNVQMFCCFFHSRTLESRRQPCTRRCYTLTSKIKFLVQKCEATD